MNPYYIINEDPRNEVTKKFNLFASDRNNINKASIKNADILICSGGDGTLLRSISKYRKFNKPIWGVNSGTIGFLMNKDIPNFTKEIDTIDLRLMKVTIEFKNEKVIVQGFNEVSIGGDMNSWIKFNIKDKDNTFGSFMGSGIIFSTTQGSTGVNRNNGGVIPPLSSDLWVVTGDKTNKRINSVISPQEVSIDFESRGSVDIWVDGSLNHFSNISRVKIEKGDLVRIAYQDIDEFERKRRTLS